MHVTERALEPSCSSLVPTPFLLSHAHSADPYCALWLGPVVLLGIKQCSAPARPQGSSRGCLSDTGQSRDRCSRQWEFFAPSLKARENAITFEELRRAHSGWSLQARQEMIRGGAEQVGSKVIWSPELGQETFLPSQ